jgi:hypothetical protein
MFVVQTFEIEGSHANMQPCLDARKRETQVAAGASKSEGQARKEQVNHLDLDWGCIHVFIPIS